MIDYLYYKLYRAAKKTSLHETAEFTACISLGGLAGINVLVISKFLAKLDILPFLFSSGFEVGATSAFLIVISCLYFLNKKEYLNVIQKYSSENKTKRVRGNIIVAVYVILSFLMIFAVPFFRTG